MKNSENVRFIGDNGYTAIRVDERSIQIASSDTHEIYKSCRPGVITIMRGIQVELGREMREFLGCLRLIRRPLGVQKIAEQGDIATWKLIRFGTGNVEEKIVCTMSIIRGRIKVVSFNVELAYDANYKKHEGLSIPHQITAGKLGEPNNLSKAVSAIMAITGISNEQLKIKSNSKKVTIYTNQKGVDEQYRFLFVRDKLGYLRLASIGMTANN